MITCPKCGFLQPEDRFCASCGVDMEKYQTRHQTPFLQRLANHYLVQAFLIIAIVLGTSMAIYRKKKADIERQLQTLSLAAEPSVAPVAEPKKAPPLAAHKKAAPSEMPPPAAPAVLPVVETTPPEKEKESEEKVQAVSNPTFHVILAEASIGFLNRLGDIRPLSGQGTINAGVVPGLETKLEAGRTTQEVRNLDEERIAARIGSRGNFSKLGQDEVLNLPMGLDVQLRPHSIDERGLHFSLTLVRTLRESPTSSSAPLPQRYTENVTLTNQAGVFVHGFLPRRKPFPGVENILPEALQYVMNSPEFLGGAYDLVLFIEGLGLPDTPSR